VPGCAGWRNDGASRLGVDGIFVAMGQGTSIQRMGGKCEAGDGVQAAPSRASQCVACLGWKTG
jgi:hypothetical protein